MSENRPKLYTIGYKGKTVEQVEKMLLENGVEYLIDVRYFPFSRWQPEFSEKNLRKYFENSKITYVSMPDFGIDPKKKKEIDRKELLKNYRKTMRNELKKHHLIFYYASKYKACLMCLEKDPSECHRSVLAELMKNRKMPLLNESFNFEIIHL